MNTDKNEELFKIAHILLKNGVESSSIRSNYQLEVVTSTSFLRNNLTNRKIGMDINFFKKGTNKIITRHMHQDKNGSSWMKIDFLAKELLEWKKQLQQDIALLFTTGDYFLRSDVSRYCEKLEKEFKNMGKFYVLDEQRLKKLLKEGSL